ncbi:MAG: esterase family protein [Clostridiales bacterium]|nr:esterase family protein [Clostridiales bacterium]
MAVINMNFLSKELKMNTVVNMIVPDSEHIGEKPLSERKVLWLLHGLSDNATSWLRLSNIERYVREADLVVVMPSGDRSMYCDNVNGQNYFTYIAKELPEYLHLMFQLSRKKEDNFIAGLSMGGMGAMKIALTYPENYAAVGSFSGVLDLLSIAENLTEDRKREFPFMLEAYTAPEHSPLNPSALLDKEKDENLRIYFSCGKQDDLYVGNCMFKEKADSLGIRTTCIFEDGTHEWGFWDKHVRKFIEFAME